MAECTTLDDLWRGRQHAELEILAAVDAQLRLPNTSLTNSPPDDAKVQLLQTVPAVGPGLAEAVHCLDDPHRFKGGDQVGSYAGLVPKLVESGQMRRVGKITRRGPSLLRGMLVEIA